MKIHCLKEIQTQRLRCSAEGRKKLREIQVANINGQENELKIWEAPSMNQLSFVNDIINKTLVNCRNSVTRTTCLPLGSNYWSLRNKQSKEDIRGLKLLIILCEQARKPNTSRLQLPHISHAYGKHYLTSQSVYCQREWFNTNVIFLLKSQFCSGL